MKINDLLGSDSFSEEVIVVFKNLPKDETDQLLMEAACLLEESHVKNWGDGYTYRVDRRPAHHGGDQLHINKKNQSWAYRHTGQKSEPNKYTLPATNTVKDIVRDVFNLSADTVIESHVVSASSERIIVEICFV